MENHYVKTPLKIKIINPFTANGSSITAGATDFDFFDKSIEDIKKESAKTTTITANPKSVEYYPNDTFTSVRNKLYISTGIPPYRQHILYKYGGSSGYNSLYTIQASTEIIAHNMMDNSVSMTSNTLVGVPIDKRLYNAKNDLSITMRDCSTQLYDCINDKYVDTVVIVDLYTVLSPNNVSVQEILNNAYQKDLLYYGFIMKYYPILPYNGFTQIYEENTSIEYTYPHLKPKFSQLETMYKKEKALMAGIISSISTMNKIRPKHPYNIVSATACFMMPTMDTRIFTDRYVLTDDHVFLAYIITIGSKTFLVTKKLATYTGSINFVPSKLPTGAIFIQTRDGVKITIGKTNGTIEMRFNESDQMTYDTLHEHISKIYKPLVKYIKKYEQLLIIDGSVDDIKKPVITSSNVYLKWPEPIYSEDFIKMKDYLKTVYGEAGIATIKNVNPGSYDLSMIHGAICCLTGRLISSNITNQYDYYTDMEYRNKVNQASYRNIQIQQHVGNTVIYCSSIGECEYEMLQNLLSYMIYKYVSEHSETKPIIDISNRTEGRKIERLKNIDPDLYSLKRYDPDAKVYTVKCQLQKQPTVYSAKEIKSLPEKVRNKLVKHWNYTEKTPAYYHCPNKKYPYLSFHPHDHPLGYCLPCCKKKVPSISSKQYIIDQACRTAPYMVTSKAYETIVSEVEQTLQHVLIFGKFIPIGRESNIPSLISKIIKTSTSKYRLVGVKQSLPLIRNAGFIYSIIEALGITMDELVKDIADVLNESTFQLLDIGNKHNIRSHVELIDTIIAVLLERDMKTLVDITEINWITLFSELLYLAYGLNVVMFNESESGLFDVQVIKTTELAITTSEKLNEYVILFSFDEGTYPLIDWSLTSHEGIEGKFLFEIQDGIMQLVKDIIDNTQTYDKLTLQNIVKFVEGSKRYAIDHLLQGKRGLIYAVILTVDGKRNKVYVPVSYTEFLSDEYDIIDEFPSDLSAYRYEYAYKFLEDYNKQMSASSRQFVPIVIGHTMKYHGKYVGFNVHTGDYGLTFLHAPTMTVGIKNIPSINCPYDIAHVNRAINGSVDNKRKTSVSSVIDEANSYVYRYNLYNLFLTEFIAEMRQHKNDKMRAEILSYIKPYSVNRKMIGELLVSYPRDYKHIINILNTNHVAKAYSLIKSILFDFDLVKLNAIKSISDYDERAKKIDDIMRTHVSLTTDKQPAGISNIYVPCNIDTVQPQCNDTGKLIISKKDYDECVKYLASDMDNPYIYETMITHTSGVINALKFSRHPHEVLRIVEYSTD